MPAEGSTFAGFNGAGCVGATCTITMTEPRHVTATFVKAPPTEPSDTTAPDTWITFGPRKPNNDHSPFRFRASEEGSTFQCSLDGAEAEDCVSGIDYTCLAPGRHTFAVWATDLAGNTDPTPATRHFRVRNRGQC